MYLSSELVPLLVVVDVVGGTVDKTGNFEVEFFATRILVLRFVRKANLL